MTKYIVLTLYKNKKKFKNNDQISIKNSFSNFNIIIMNKI